MSYKQIALLLGVLTVGLLTVTAPAIGLTWDEPAYITASESYVAWLQALVDNPGQALRADQIQFYWEPNHEHPPLDKIWSGLVWAVARSVFDDLTAHRLGNMLLVGWLVALLYLMVAEMYGRVAGLAAVAALLTLPRFFFHAHLAALDVPAAVVVFTVIYLFWRIREKPAWYWDIGLGVAWGLALATKVNAVFIPPTLLLWALAFQRRLRLLVRLVVMGLVGVPVSLGIWPWLYHDFWERLVAYIRFVTVDHWKIGQWYLGQFYMPPPWHFPFVMTVAVVPLTLMLLCGLGIARVMREKPARPMGSLLLLGMLVPLLALTTGKSMVYDNERLFMPAFPYLAALAGIGFDGVAWGLGRYLPVPDRPTLVRGVPALLAGIVFVPHTLLAASLYPHLLSYYSETIGGLPGAARLGLEHTYWCETYAAALPYLNQHAPWGATIWVQDWSHDVLLYYQLHGQLRSDLKIHWPRYARTVFEREGARGYTVGLREADIVLLQYRQTGFDSRLRGWLQGRQPAYLLQRQGVPLMAVFQKSRP